MNFCNFDDNESDDEDDFLVDSSDNNDYRTNSSSSSLVWSAEARKQNEADWRQIERILYCEENLPGDEKSREEFSEWMEAFPHLRIIGTKIKLPPRPQLNYNPQNFVDEIIAIDPPPPSESFKNLDFELNEKLSIRRARQSANGVRHVRDDELEKFLRVTSSGVVRNQQQISRKTVDKTVVMKQSNNNTTGISFQNDNRKLSKIHENKKLHSANFLKGSNIGIDEKLIIHSATPPRPPHDVKFVYKKPNRVVTFDEVKSVKSASKLPMYAEISRIEPMKANKTQLSSKSASIHHSQRRANLNSIRLPPFSYDIEYPFIESVKYTDLEVRGYNQKSNLNISKH